MPDNPGLAAETEAFELDELEHAAARLMHQWIARSVAAIDAAGSEDLAVAAERADQAGQVLDLLERVLSGIEQIRETID